MEPGGSMPHSQGLSNNPYPEPNQPNYRIDTYLFEVYDIRYKTREWNMKLITRI